MRSLTIDEVLFGLRGRISREVYGWAWALVACVGAPLLLPLGMAAMGDRVAAAGLVAGLVLVGWAKLALVVKRCHDIGLPDWFATAAFIPVIGEVWILALGFIPGEGCDNDFGHCPIDRLA